MQSLNGRIALVTGASQGIGRACALVLAEAGATVALAARNEENLREAAAQITGAGGKAAVYKLDVSSEEEIKAVAKQIIADHGKVDILVNNAGITRDQIVHAHETLRLGRGAGHQSDCAVSAHPGRPRLHAQAALGAHYQYHQHLRQDGPDRAGELLFGKSRPDRVDHVGGARGRLQKYNRQCHRSGLD